MKRREGGCEGLQLLCYNENEGCTGHSFWNFRIVVSISAKFILQDYPVCPTFGRKRRDRDSDGLFVEARLRSKTAVASAMLASLFSWRVFTRALLPKVLLGVLGDIHMHTS